MCFDVLHSSVHGIDLICSDCCNSRADRTLDKRFEGAAEEFLFLAVAVLNGRFWSFCVQPFRGFRLF